MYFKDRAHLLSGGSAVDKVDQMLYVEAEKSLGLILGHLIVLMSTSNHENMNV